jgi:hypothetical protein
MSYENLLFSLRFRVHVGHHCLSDKVGERCKFNAYVDQVGGWLDNVRVETELVIVPENTLQPELSRLTLGRPTHSNIWSISGYPEAGDVTASIS